MVSEPRKIWIPRVGDYIRLEEPWTFTLSRGGGKQRLSPGWSKRLREQEAGDKFDVTFPGGTVLRIEVVSLRTSSKDYYRADAVTFTVARCTEDDALRDSRIWSRLNDVNEISATKLDTNAIKKLKASIKRKTFKKKEGKLYAEDVRARIFPEDQDKSPWDVPEILNTVGKWLMPQLKLIPAVHQGQISAEEVLAGLLSKEHEKNWKLLNHKTHTFRHPTVRSLKWQPKSEKFDGVFAPIPSKCSSANATFNDTFSFIVESDPHDRKLTRVLVKFNEHVKNPAFGKRGRGSQYVRDSYKKFITKEHIWEGRL